MSEAAESLETAVAEESTLTRKDFQTDQEVRWCPGCGDYTILASVQSFLAEQGKQPKDIVFISGIGCSSRFPYYTNTYGMHSIHGRAPAIASGIAISRPDLQVWVVTGDGDALSIGGNHLIHALRRNVDIKVLLFNNQIYGLTKGQYSPTSEQGKVTKSTPFGSLDQPFNPVSLALGAEASFVARTVDMDRSHTSEVLEAAAMHRGAALVEIYQNCNVFNDKAFEAITGKLTRDANQIRLVDNEPVIFGAEQEKCVVLGKDGITRIADVADVEASEIVIHNTSAPEPSLAFALSRLSESPVGPTPIGVFRDVERPVYGDEVYRQIEEAKSRPGPDDVAGLLRSAGTWEVG